MNISSTPLEIASSGQDQGVAKLLSDLIRHPVETVSEVRRFLGVTRTVIEERLGPLARCAGTSPEVFSRRTEVTYLSLADSGLSTFPQQDSFVNLVELNLSWSQRTLIPESIVNLPLKRLSLCGILGGINLHEILILLRGALLSRLDLGWNNLKDAEAEQVGSIMRESRTLELIDLTGEISFTI